MLKEKINAIWIDVLFLLLITIMLAILFYTEKIEAPQEDQQMFLSPPKILGVSIVGAAFILMLIKIIFKIAIITVMIVNKRSRRKIIGFERNMVKRFIHKIK